MLIARELIIRNQLVNGRRWCHFFALCFTLAFNAFYELIEWLVATVTGESAEAFLGAQGYIWDTQSDMLWALIGGIVALLALANYHDKQINKIQGMRNRRDAGV